MPSFTIAPLIDGNPVNATNELGNTVFYALDTVFSPTFASLSGPSSFPSRSGAVTGTDLTGSFEGGVGRFSGGTVTGIDLIRDSDSTVFAGMTGLSISATALGEFMSDDNAAGLVAVLLRGNDRIITSTGNDVVQGMRGADDMFGEAGDDQLFGGRGADSLHGWAGQDTLTGGAGRDAFVFEIAPGSADADEITDFRSPRRRRPARPAVCRRRSGHHVGPPGDF
jgi:RTX calcium-binding nonapeptide repeat (4 copies)